jgi:cytochrome c553
VKRVNLLAAAAATVAAFPGAAAADTGSSVWAQAGCGGCHTLAAAGSTGTAGPNLDYLRPSAGAVAAQVTYGGGGMPSFGSSLSSAQIQMLAAWVAGSAGGTTPTTGASTGTPSTGAATPLMPNMPVAQVKKVQAALKRLGYFHHAVTGFYGPITEAAVKAFQRAHGLTVDGLWGTQSQAALVRATRH